MLSGKTAVIPRPHLLLPGVLLPMRLRLLLLTAAALLTLVPALAFADQDSSGDTDKEPVALTTPVAAAPTTDQVTDRTEHAAQVVDRNDHADQVVDRNEHADQA